MIESKSTNRYNLPVPNNHFYHMLPHDIFEWLMEELFFEYAYKQINKIYCKHIHFFATKHILAIRRVVTIPSNEFRTGSQNPYSG